MNSSRIQRVIAVLEGRQPDRPPVSFWYHFAPDQRYGPQACAAHLEHLRRYDLDFLKIMNDNGYPGPQGIATAADLRNLRAAAGDEPQFTRQLELIRNLAAATQGEVLLVTTVFNAWATLRRLVRPRVTAQPGPPNLEASGDPASDLLTTFMDHDRGAVVHALEVVASSLARFVTACLQAGAHGIFVSVRDDWLDHGSPSHRRYAEFVRDGDLRILQAAGNARFNLLHVCGRAVDFEAFARYPVHAINWADRAAGPTLRAARDRTPPALCGGVDNLNEMPNGTPQQVADQVRDAIAQAAPRPIIIAPGCTFDPATVPQANLDAMCQAARH